jgi:hypothetical protein
MPLRGRQRTRRYNNNAGALTIFWRSGGRSFSEIEGKKEAHFDERRSPSSALQAPVVIPMAARDRDGKPACARALRGDGHAALSPVSWASVFV